MNASAKESLHPFFLQKIGDKVQFAKEGMFHSWVDPSEKTAYFDDQCLKDMKRDKKVGYLGIGMDLINYALKLGANEVTLESEKARQMAADMVTASYSSSLQGIVTAKDTEEALSYLKEKGAKLRIRGMGLAVMVEHKMFMPATGLTSDGIMLGYLGRPVKVDYAQLLGNEFNLSPSQRTTIEQYAETQINPVVSLTQRNPIQMERDLLADLDRKGFRGQNAIIRAYQNGDIGKKIVETYK
mgnify:CR=1 FL=1